MNENVTFEEMFFWSNFLNAEKRKEIMDKYLSNSVDVWKRKLCDQICQNCCVTKFRENAN